MTATNNKNMVLMAIPDDGYSISSDPNFVYLTINDGMRSLLESLSDMVIKNDLITVSKNIDEYLYFVHDPADDCVDDSVEQAHPADPTLKVDSSHFWLDIRMKGATATISTAPIPIADLYSKAGDSADNQINLTFFSEWDDGSEIGSDAVMDALTGGLVIEEAVALPDNDAQLVRQYVTDDNGEEYRVFCIDNTNTYFLAPTEIYNLFSHRPEEDLRPGQ